MTLLCQTCLYDYNYILRYENISEEEKLFVEEIGNTGGPRAPPFLTIISSWRSQLTVPSLTHGIPGYQ